MKRSTAVAGLLVVVAVLAATLLFYLSRGAWADRQTPTAPLELPTLAATAVAANATAANAVAANDVAANVVAANAESASSDADVVTSPAGSATRPASEDADSATSAEPSPQPSPTGRGGAEPTPTGQRGALTATLDPALDPDRHAVRGPVTVIFDRPVNATIHTRPLTFSPAIRGTFAWNADATAVTFTPTGHFRTATTYTVGVDDELRGRDGATFAAPPTWSLYVVTPPQVSRRAPMTTKGSDRQPEFRLTFNRPLDTNSVGAALSVAPDVALDLTWDGDDLLLRPAALLDPGVRYEFTLDETCLLYTSRCV